MSIEIGKEIVVSFEGKTIARLPKELHDIGHAIENSRYILDLKTGFDGESAEPPAPEIWSKAVVFVSNYANWLFDIFGKTMAPPKIYHGPDRSIDIYWENTRFNLLINIPAGDSTATFYGDNYGGQVTEGRFDPDHFQNALLPDLSLIS